MICNRPNCNRFHKIGHWPWADSVPIDLYCSIFSRKTNKKNSPCEICLQTSIYPIPLSEFK